MALVVSPLQAAAIMLPILCLMDLVGLWAYRGSWDRRNLAIMIPGAVAGIVVGALSFHYLDESLIRLLIGGITIVFALDYWIGRRPQRAAIPHPAKGGAWCAVSGFTSFIAHAGGPPMQVYLLPQRLDRTLYVGTTVVYFFAVNYVKLIPYGMLGQFSTENLTTAVGLLPLAPLGIWFGIALHRVVPDRPFYRICYGALLVTGLKLIWDGAAAQGWLGL